MPIPFYFGREKYDVFINFPPLENKLENMFSTKNDNDSSHHTYLNRWLHLIPKIAFAIDILKFELNADILIMYILIVLHIFVIVITISVSDKIFSNYFKRMDLHTMNVEDFPYVLFHLITVHRSPNFTSKYHMVISKRHKWWNDRQTHGSKFRGRSADWIMHRKGPLQ